MACKIFCVSCLSLASLSRVPVIVCACVVMHCGTDGVQGHRLSTVTGNTETRGVS